MSTAPRLTLALLGLSALLTFLASLCELVLAGVVQHRLHYARVKTAGEDGLGVPTTSSTLLLPQYVWSGPNFVTGYSAAELGAAAVTLVVSILTIVWTALSFRRTSQSPAKDVSVAIAVLATMSFIVNLGIFAWIFSVHDGSGTFYLDSPPPASPGETDLSLFEVGWSDTIDWEKYLCGIAQAVRQYEGGKWFATSCTYNVASRWTMVPLFIMSFLTAVLLWAAVGSNSSSSGTRPVENVEKPEEHQAIDGPAERAA